MSSEIDREIIRNWLFSVVLGSLFWACLIEWKLFLLILLVSDLLSVPYLLIALVLMRNQKVNSPRLFYIQLFFFLMYSVIVFQTPSTIPYFHWFVVPYFVTGFLTQVYFQKGEDRWFK